MINLFDNNNEDFQFILEQMGSDVTINNNPSRVLITNTNLEQNYDDRKITSLSPLNRGDIVLFEGKKYLIISEVNTKRYSKYKGIMRLLPHRIRINSECRFIHLDCYINTSNLGVLDGRLLSTPDGEITVISTLINNDFELKLDARFLLYSQVFKVTGIDQYSKPGLFILTCKKDLIDDETDDLINGIAGGNGCPINIVSNDIALTVGTTYQLTWTSTNNAPVAFKSSDDIIATVDARGLVTGLAEGVVTITIANATNEQIQDTVTVTVSAVQSGYTISLTSMGDLDQINKGYARTYKAVVTENGNVVSEPVQWQLFDDSQTSSTMLAEITSQDDGKCVVKGLTVGYVQLKVSLVSDQSVFSWYRVRIKSLL